MDGPKQMIFPKQKSAPPSQPLASPISALLEGTGLGIAPQAVIQLSDIVQRDVAAGYDRLVAMDRSIGGVGLHNVNRKEGEELTGAYRIKLRPLFRPIQYVFSWISDDDLTWNARRIVQDSCLHVEYAVKFRFHISETKNASLGVLLDSPPVRQELEPLFLDLLRSLNRVVYRKAKHTIEDIRLDSHQFSPADALAVYLVCRWAGNKLLEPTGLLNDWEEPA